jgi:hypothetical protein
MAKKIKLETEPEAAPSVVPVNRIVRAESVKVRATCHLAEEIDGVNTRFAPDDEFELPAERAKALGRLVKILGLFLAMLGLSAVAAGLNGYETKTASGSTTASVTFPGSDAGTRLITLDVTSDKAGSLAKWCAGTTPYRIAAPAASDATTIYIHTGTTLLTNGFVIAQNSTNGVGIGKVTATNGIAGIHAYLDAPLSVAVTAGDSVNKLLTATPYKLVQNHAFNAAALYVDNLTGIGTNVSVAYSSPTGYVTRVVAATNTATVKSLPISPRVERSLAVSDAVYENAATVYGLVNATIAYDSVTVTVSNINGIAGADRVLIEGPNGQLAVRVVDSVSTSNVVLTVAPGFALAAGNRLYELTSSDYVVKQAVNAGAARVLLDTTNGLVTADSLVFVSAADGTFKGTVGGLAEDASIYTLTLTDAIGQASPAGTEFYKLTNSHPVTLTTSAGNPYVVIANVTNVAVGDALLIAPTAGGFYRRSLQSWQTNSYASLTLSALGIVVAANDPLYLVGITNSVAVGAASVARSGEAVFLSKPGRPALLLLDGTSACSINSATAKY